MSALQSASHSVYWLPLEIHINTYVIERLEKRNLESISELVITFSRIMK
ncbi:hypothetical protein DTX80_10035 [Bacilli bacterium]|nr:hypothetical protein DEJ64_12705 [Bacilli bacterium]PZD85508.1 hypothetical protein DEJ60_12120 [Bacilli bacterium]PZD88524.1 hypothetical protein DEJ66_12835 [Bacilli bacterium]RCO05737.1 hypothetical protein DTX80_10035 [Bacilli bacterium]RCO10163.1 hypothetical protein DTX79_05970 [Bacilli bacterium]